MENPEFTTETPRHGAFVSFLLNPQFYGHGLTRINTDFFITKSPKARRRQEGICSVPPCLRGGVFFSKYPC